MSIFRFNAVTIAPIGTPIAHLVMACSAHFPANQPFQQPDELPLGRYF
ncbi:hypothetical protein yrohd0001_9960 [Yersinia rohdei ATCC 43380]|nr:hypothetical protein yrohd0001_9960 [Yersinia rohdei ATCC 43380]